MTTHKPPNLPKYSDLPYTKGDPRKSAWGLYGKDDELGFLNRQTDEIVAAAAKSEIKTGVRISLNWPLDAQGDLPLFGRQIFHKDIYQKHPRIVHDDTWTFNTQSSSQCKYRCPQIWTTSTERSLGDGLRHFAYQKEQKFYNGVTVDQISGENKTNVNGIQAWSEKGIVGRGVLLDYHAWRQGKNTDFEPLKTSGISVKDLQAVAEAQGTEIKFGDILVVRSGFMAAYNDLSRDEVKALMSVNPPGLGGIEQGDNTLEWIWDNFSAVSGDQPSFERWPTPFDWSMHEVLLAGWGCPIGELFDLELLAAHCKKENRYSFFVASEPTNVPGGVASPPNILAIF